MKHLLIRVLALISLAPLSASAQQIDSLQMIQQDKEYKAAKANFFAHLEASTFFDGTQVRLRWLPDAPGGWMNANLLGYRVERLDLGVLSEEVIDTSAKFIPLTQEVLKPLSIEGWRAYHEEHPDDNYGLMAGEMIHSALLPENVGFNPDMVDAAALLKERMGLALLGADLSWNAAVGSALGLADKSIVKGHSYMYRISVNSTSGNYPIDTAYAFASTDSAEVIPRPEIQAAKGAESTISISWDREKHDQLFTAYWIERSSDGGKNFKRRNKLPFIAFTNPELPSTLNSITYTDSVDRMYVPQLYRIVGINSFGMESLFSNTVKAMARDATAPPSPYTVRVTEDTQNELTVTWEYTDTVPDLKGFHVLRTNNEFGDEHVLLNEQPLPKNTRKFVDKHPVIHAHNYYLVVAVDTAGNTGLSLGAWGAINDSLPPAAPTQLTGKVDTSGVVTLNWQRGMEPDLYGYYVFMRNGATDVGARITPYPVRDTTFTDTITMATITEDVYYQVVALDVVRNNSQPSQQLKLKRPDLRAPVSPLLVDYKVDEKGIWIKWANSSSADVALQVLLRRQVGASAWDTLMRYEPTKDLYSTYTDKDKGKGGRFEYTVLARDDDGLWSPMANSFKLRLMSREGTPTVKKLKARYNAEQKTVDLNWEYDQREAVVFVVMRSNERGTFDRVKMLGNDQRVWRDGLVKEGVEYQYFIQVVDPHGEDSPYSEKVSVKL